MLVCSSRPALFPIYITPRLFYLPLTLIGVAIGVVLVPNLSEYLEGKNINLQLGKNKLLISFKYNNPFNSSFAGLSVEIVSFLLRGENLMLNYKEYSFRIYSFLLGLPAASL